MSEEAKHGRKAPYKPSDAAVAALSAISAQIESLTQSDRGHVLARLREIYLAKPSEKTERTSKKSASDKVSGPPKRKPKASWKVEWEASPEFSAWQKARGDGLAQSEWQGLQYAALEKRAALRAQHNWVPPSPSSPPKEKKKEKSSE